MWNTGRGHPEAKTENSCCYEKKLCMKDCHHVNYATVQRGGKEDTENLAVKTVTIANS